MIIPGLGVPAGLIAGQVGVNVLAWNPLQKNSLASLSNSNRTLSGSSANYWCGSVAPKSSGKLYAEINTAGGAVGHVIGVAGATESPGSVEYIGATGTQGYGLYLQGSGVFWSSGSRFGTPNVTGPAVIGIAFDIDNRKIWFAVNNSWVLSGDPASGSNPITTVISGVSWVIAAGADGGYSLTLPEALTYAPPSGFLRWSP